MYESVLRILELSSEYIDYIDEIGNECAYTDRIVEEIYEEAEVLHKKHDDYFANLDTKAFEEELIKQTKPLVEKLNAKIEKILQDAKDLYESHDDFLKNVDRNALEEEIVKQTQPLVDEINSKFLKNNAECNMQDTKNKPAV